MIVQEIIYHLQKAHKILTICWILFNEKGKLIGMLQMFMTKESIADRIQQELIRLTSHLKQEQL